MKGATVYPLGEVSRESVERYLLRRGNLPEMIAWKYFDAPFSRGRERGLVWLHRGEVCGFIGLIPFCLQNGSVLREIAWTCDWSLDDPGRTPGMGIVLLRAAVDAARYTMALGGNELTRSLLPRIASQTIENAGVEYVLPLRLGHVLEKVDRRMNRLMEGAPRLARSFLGSLPMPGGMAKRGRILEVVPGVSRTLEPMLIGRQDGCSRPVYDFEYVHWQCGRCPEIESWTCFEPAAEGERAAALIFRRLSLPSHWRLAWWVDSGAGSRAVEILRTAATFAYERAGTSLSVLIAGADEERAALLRAQGFVRLRGGQPLFVTAADRQGFVRLGEVRSLSYLDTDLAHLP